MILITGASGNVGQEIVRLLHEEGYPIRVLSRNPGKVVWPAGVEEVAGDLADPASQKKALHGITKAFLMAVPGGESFPKTAQELGVAHIVLLSSSAVGFGANNRITGTHAQMEELIKQSGVPWTILRPGPFMSNALHWGESIRSLKKVAAPYGDAGLTVIDPRDIASVAVRSLLSSGHFGKTYTLTGPELLTPVEQIHTIGEVLGEQIVFEFLSESAAREEMKRHMPEENVDAVLQIRKAASAQQTILPTVEEITGRSARTFKQFVTDNIDAFQ